ASAPPRSWLRSAGRRPGVELLCVLPGSRPRNSIFAPGGDPMKRPLGNLAPRYAPAILGALLLAGCTSQSAEAPTAAVEPAAAAAAEKQEKQEQREQAPARTVAPFTILVMGDNRGEIVPCGCKDFPRGGLPRRATFVQEARAAGPVLLLDAGD